MTPIKEPAKGRFSVEVELTNHEDLFRADAGLIRPDQVRRARIHGVVNSGAPRLVIPATVAQQLGLEISGSAKDKRSGESNHLFLLRLKEPDFRELFGKVTLPLSFFQHGG